MATQIAETKWHGNPRPILAYTTSVEDGEVASPYYLNGRNVPVHKHFVTPVPLVGLLPKATIATAGPAVLVDFKMDGLWKDPITLNVVLTVVGSPNVSRLISFGPSLVGPVEAAEHVAEVLRGAGNESLTIGTDGQTVIISAGTPTTAITITTLTVA